MGVNMTAVPRLSQIGAPDRTRRACTSNYTLFQRNCKHPPPLRKGRTVSAAPRQAGATRQGEKGLLVSAEVIVGSAWAAALWQSRYCPRPQGRGARRVI